MHYLLYLLSQKCLLQPHGQWQRLLDKEMLVQDLKLQLKHQRKPKEMEKEIKNIQCPKFVTA